LAAVLPSVASLAMDAPEVAQEKIQTSYSSQVGPNAQGLGLAETPNMDRIANEGAKMMT
jgi:hypothetical protein